MFILTSKQRFLTWAPHALIKSIRVFLIPLVRWGSKISFSAFLSYSTSVKCNSWITQPPKTKYRILLKMQNQIFACSYQKLVWNSQNCTKQSNHRLYIKPLCVIVTPTNNVKFFIRQMLQFLEFWRIFQYGKHWQYYLYWW